MVAWIMLAGWYSLDAALALRLAGPGPAAVIFAMSVVVWCLAVEAVLDARTPTVAGRVVPWLRGPVIGGPPPDRDPRRPNPTERQVKG